MGRYFGTDGFRGEANNNFMRTRSEDFSDGTMEK